jgi:hypothetical protein
LSSEKYYFFTFLYSFVISFWRFLASDILAYPKPDDRKPQKILCQTFFQSLLSVPDIPASAERQTLLNYRYDGDIIDYTGGNMKKRYIIRIILERERDGFGVSSIRDAN